MRSLLAQLGRRGLLHVLCEGGGRLAGSLVRARCVNTFLFFIAGRVMGGGVPVIETAGWPLARAPRLRFKGEERVGEDLLVCAEPWEST